MAKADDIARIIEQEQKLVLTSLDENVAYAIGSSIRDRAFAEGFKLVVDVRTWDRQMFFAALPGTNPDNSEWVRRKINTVRRYQKASYRFVVERDGDAVFPPVMAADPTDYVIAGGGFPLRVAGAGIIGAVTISGLPGREDHNVAVAALCDHLGIDRASLALGPES